MDETYINLVLTMISAYDDYEGDMKYTKEDIKKIIDKHKVLNDIKCNELGWIILWKNKYVTPEVFADKMDLEYDNKEFWIVADDFSDILPSKYDTEAEILDGTAEWSPGEWYDHDVESYFSDYTEETLKAIIEFCDRHGLELDHDDYDETILLSKENMKVVRGDILINGTIKITDVLDELDELKNSLNGAICEAQESADQGEMYKMVENEFLNEIGDYKYKTMKINGKDVKKLLVNISFDWSDLEYELKQHYGEFEFQEEYYGSVFEILKELGYFNKFTGVDLDRTYGSINDDILNEYTQNRLGWD